MTGIGLIEKSNQYYNVLNSIMELEKQGDTVPEGLIAQLEKALESQADGVDACAMVINRAEYELSWLNKEQEIIEAKKQEIKNKVERLKQLAMSIMHKEGIKKLIGSSGHTMSLRTSKSVDVIDESEVPAQFVRVTQTTHINKAKALEALKSGVEIPGLALKKRSSVVIK